MIPLPSVNATVLEIRVSFCFNFKVAVTSLKLEMRLHARTHDHTLEHTIARSSTRSGTEAIFTLIVIHLAHAFGIGYFACSLISGAESLKGLSFIVASSSGIRTRPGRVLLRPL